MVLSVIVWQEVVDVIRYDDKLWMLLNNLSKFQKFLISEDFACWIMWIGDH